MLDQSRLAQIFEQYMGCQNSDELAHFIETTPEALDFEFHKTVTDYLRQTMERDDVPGEFTEAMKMQAEYFFCILGERILAEADAKREALKLIQGEPDIEKINLSPEQRVQNVLAQADTDLRQVRSQADLARVATRLILNFIAAETIHRTAPSDEVQNNDVEPVFIKIWLPIVDSLLKAEASVPEAYWKRVSTVLQEHHLEAAVRFMETWRGRLSASEWSHLPIQGLCKASLHRVSCPACNGLSWVDFWNVVHRSDLDLSTALAEGHVNRYACAFCGYAPAKLTAILPIPDYLDSSFLYRMVYYHDPEYGSIYKMPDSITSRQQKYDKILERRSLAMANAAKDDFPPPSTERGIYSAYFTYSWEEFQERFSHLEEMHRWANESFELVDDAYIILLRPLVQMVRNGEMTLEAAEEQVFEILKQLPNVLPKGFAYIRKFDSADADEAIMIALLATMNAAAGFTREAWCCLMSAATQSFAASRLGESLRFLDKMDELFAKVDTEPLLLNTVRGQAELLRANIYFTLADIEQGLAHMRKAINANQRILTELRHPGDEGAIFEATLNLAGCLCTYGTRVKQIDMNEGYKALNAALELCNQLEQKLHVVPTALESEYRRGLLHTKSGTLSNLGALMSQFKRWGILVARMLSESTEGETEYLDTELLELVERITFETFVKNLFAFIGHFVGWPEKEGEKIAWGPDVFEEIAQRELDYFQQAYEISRVEKDYQFAARQAMNIATCYRERANLDQALHYSQLSEEHARKAQDVVGLVQTLTNFGAILIEAGQLAEARAKLKSAYMEWTRLRQYLVLDPLRVAASKAITPILANIPKTLTADQPHEWISILETMKSASLSDALLYGQIRLADMNPEDSDVRELIALERQIEKTRAQQVVSELIWPLGRGIRDIEIIADTTSSERPSGPTLEELQALYDEQRQKVLLRHPRFSRWHADMEVQFMDITEALSRIYNANPEAAFVGIWIDEDDVLVYGAIPEANTPQCFALRIPLLARLREEGAPVNKSLDKFIVDYRAKLSELGNAPEKLADFQNQFAGPLFQALFKPIEAKLGRITQIILSGHGALHSIPWGTMWDGTRYAVERFAFSQVFSLNFLIHFDPNRCNLQRPSVLAIVDPSLGDARLALPGAREEIRALKKIVTQIGGSLKTFAGQDANVSNFFAHSVGKDIIHLACHAQFDESHPWKSSLLLAPLSSQEGEIEETGQLTMLKIAEWLNLEGASLVVLSACETGLARVEVGDEVLCLTRSFYIAGAPRVLASLWNISDKSTQLLMKRMYHYLLCEQQTIANSLRFAQLDLLHDTSSPDVNNPFVWGSFVLYGM